MSVVMIKCLGKNRWVFLVEYQKKIVLWREFSRYIYAKQTADLLMFHVDYSDLPETIEKVS